MTAPTKGQLHVPRRTTRRGRALQWIVGSGDRGMSNPDLQPLLDDATAASVHETLKALVMRGLIHAGKRQGERTRYFSSAAYALAYADAPAVPAPVTIAEQRPMAPRGDAVIPERVRPTVGLSAGYDERYQVGPGWAPGPDSFSAAGIGRDIEGRPWAP